MERRDELLRKVDYMSGVLSMLDSYAIEKEL